MTASGRSSSRSRRRARVAAALLALAVVALLGLQIAETVAGAGRRIGMVIETDDAGLRVTAVLPGLGAARAGIHAGDRVVAVGPVAVASEADYDRVAAGFAAGQPVRFTVDRDGARVHLDVMPGGPVPWLDQVWEAATVIAYLALAVLTLLQPGHDLRARVLFCFSAAVAVELALPNAGPAGLIGRANLDLVSNVAFFVLTGVQIGFELHLASLIPAPAPWVMRSRVAIPAFYLTGSAIGVVASASVLADRFGWAMPWSYATTLAVVDTVVLAFWALAVTAICAYQARAARDAVGRHQASLVLAGTFPWAVYTLISAATEAAGRTLPGWVATFEPLVLLCYPAAVFVAIFRYRLLDFERVVRRSVLYSVLTGAVMLLSWALVGTGSALLADALGGGEPVVVVAAATLVLGLLFTPLQRAVQRWIDNRLFPERDAQRRLLAGLAAELPAFGKVPLMGRHLVSRLEEIFGARPATLLLAEAKAGVLVAVASTRIDPEREFDSSLLLAADDPGVQVLQRTKRPVRAALLAGASPSLAQRLRVFEAALVVPVCGPGRLVGLILLGGRADGGAFTAEELELLALLSHHVASVLENARLFESATTDGLTGLLRREAILETLERELRRAVRYRRPLAIAMADLDRFKVTNDTHGHLAGDAVLKAVARTLGSELRGADAVGRWGGEEFLLVLPETDIGGAAAVAEKVREAVSRVAVRLDDGSVLRVTVSIGLAALTGRSRDAGVSKVDLIAAADANLLRAKAAGRDRVEPAAVVAAYAKGWQAPAG